MNFTHLHVHTEYSLLDGASKIKELVARAKELGMDSLAITDHGVMYGVIDFYRAAKAEGIKPIIGCEIYVSPGSRFDRELSKGDDRYNHLVLLAENDKGYHNLMKIVSKGFTEGFYYKPRVDYEVLEQYHEGIIATSACLAGAVASRLARGMYDEAKEEALKLQSIFGENNFFLELQDHGIDIQKTVNQGIMRLHAETGIPLVATNDSHYTYAEDEEAHDILLCIQTRKTVEDEDRMRYEGGQFYLKSPEEMAQVFSYAPEALENTHKIAERCNVEITFGEYKLPHFDVPEGYDSESYLRKLCDDGLKWRYEGTGKDMKALKERLDYELDVITNMGFVDYFLIVWDFIKYAKDSGIPVGPGRGSAAGSIVSYVLNITDLIDPIEYNLLFERFLNPGRVTMPDIDVDFCIEGRQQVIDYVTEKYGKDQVVQIVTFGTMAAKMVIRDVGRALSLPYAQVDMVAKMIPADLGMTIDKALKLNGDLKSLYDSDPVIKKLVDMSRRLEGLPRHTSIHAAGVVISPKPVDEFVPLSKSTDDIITTQYTMVTLEELGLLKMDFLGLRNLTVLKKATEGVVDLRKIDYSDPKVYAMISEGKTDGVFQLESDGMKNFMKELKPERLEDIIAGSALYRPGPMDFIPKYISGKNNRDTIQYDCPELEPILSNTYGCIVYQEQVMQIVRDLAGYSYGRSDEVRRAMSKKKVAVMEREKNNFIYGNEEEGVEGCIKRGISKEVAEKIYDEMTDFAKYAFNKSHAAAYAIITFQTAYVKLYYPREFLAALLTSVKDNSAKKIKYIMSCKEMGIKMFAPDVNDGDVDFMPTPEGIKYSLAAIKSVGEPMVRIIVEEREKGGKFTSLEDFCSRLVSKGVNKKAVEALIKAGALDSVEGNRRQKMLAFPAIMDSVASERKKNVEGQMSFLDIAEDDDTEDIEIKLPDVGEYDRQTLLANEKEVLGIYFSGHPLEDYMEVVKKNISRTSADFVPLEEGELPRVKDQATEIVAGIIENVNVKTTRTQNRMAFLNLEDQFGTIEVIVFSKQFEKYRFELREDNKVFIRGRVSLEEDKPGKLICLQLLPFDEIPRRLWLQFKDRESYEKNEQQIFEILSKYDGNDKTSIYLSGDKKAKELPAKYDTEITGELLEELYRKFGEDNVKVVQESIEKKLFMS